MASLQCSTSCCSTSSCARTTSSGRGWRRPFGLKDRVQQVSIAPSTRTPWLLGTRREHATVASASGQSEHKSDPFVAATVRLQSLLAGVGDGEEELVNSMLAEDSPSEKLRVNALLGTLYIVAGCAVCALCGSDPWGGASLSLHSASCAAVGALLAAPLAALRAWSWGRQAANLLPELEDIHRTQLEEAKPWLAGCQSQHVVMLLALEQLPLLFLLLPVAQGGLAASYSHYNDALAAGIGARLPEHLGVGLAMLATAGVVGVSKGLELSVSDEEYDVVKSAVENADRFYRLTTPDDAQRASTAFKAVAVSWMSSKDKASALAGALGLLDVLYLGAVWHWTGDFTAAAVAGLLAHSVDYFQMYELVTRGQRRNEQQGHSH